MHLFSRGSGDAPRLVAQIAVPAAWLAGLLVFGPIGLGQREPGALGLGPFPTGLAITACVATGQRFAPLWARLATVAASSAVVGLVLLRADFAPARALGFALACACTCLVTTLLLGREPGLRSESELGRLLAGIGLGAVTNGIGYYVVSDLSGVAQPWPVAASGVLSCLGSTLFYLPFALPKPRRMRPVTGRERAIAWVAFAVVCGLVFSTIPTASEFPYLVLPVLAWGAVRLTMWDSVLQLATVVIVATASGNSDSVGPLHPPVDQLSSPDLNSFYLEIFLIICVVMTLTLSVIFHIRMSTAAALHGEREQLEHIVRGATGLLVVGLNLDGTVHRFNEGASALTGYRPDEVIGINPACKLSPHDLKRHEQALASSIQLGSPGSEAQRFLALVAAMARLPEPRAFDWRIRCRDGSNRICSITFAPLTNDLGDITGFIGTGEDITDRVNAAEATRQALRAERAAVEHLQEVDRVKDLLVSTVSHELRTPITNIMGYLELMIDGELGEPTPQQRDALGRMELNSTRLMSLIDDLLTLSRVSSQDFEMGAHRVDLVDIAGAVVTLVGPQTVAKQQTFQVDRPAEPIWVTGSAEELERVITNLLTNAVKFTPAEGTVSLKLSTHNQQAVIEVSDTGIGIPEDEQSHLFEQFFRSSVSRDLEIQGTGLGLSIVRTIVGLHHGTVQVCSSPGEGSTFRVLLPLAGVTAKPDPGVAIPHRRLPDQAW